MLIFKETPKLTNKHLNIITDYSIDTALSSKSSKYPTP